MLWFYKFLFLLNKFYCIYMYVYRVGKVASIFYDTRNKGRNMQSQLHILKYEKWNCLKTQMCILWTTWTVLDLHFTMMYVNQKVCYLVMYKHNKHTFIHLDWSITCISRKCFSPLHNMEFVQVNYKFSLQL